MKPLSFTKKIYGAHFQKDEQGMDIYYPWGNAGDSWYVSSTQKRILKISYVIAGVGGFLFTLFFGLNFPDYSDESIAITVFNAVVLAWLIFFYFYSKKMEPVKQQAPSIRKPELPKVLSVIMAVLVGFLILGFWENPTDPLLKISASFVFVVYPLLIWFVRRKQGYILQKMQPLAEDQH